MNDTEALDAIGTLLGDAEDWSDPATFLERIAGLVGESGRPHPGLYAGDSYEADVEAARLWSQCGPGQRSVLTAIADLTGSGIKDNDEYSRACREVIANGLELGLVAYDDDDTIVALVRCAVAEGNVA